MTIWALCAGQNEIKPLKAEPWRVVEAQHILSARDLVDSIEEHDILESMLENSKPAIDKKKHYLIFSPFRYPPLKYGSRFGQAYEPSLWYGSIDLPTALAEVAYYQLKFRLDSDANLDYIETRLTAFQATFTTEQGIDLTNKPFDKYREQISAQNSYEHSHRLGSVMREAGVEAFIFFSARVEDNQKNIAAFTPQIFGKKNDQEIYNQQTWLCIANKQVVEFSRTDVSGRVRYSYGKELVS